MCTIKKCNIISITNATKNKIHHQYTMDNEPLNSIDTYMYVSIYESRWTADFAGTSTLIKSALPQTACWAFSDVLCIGLGVLSTWRKRLTKLQSVPSWNTVPASGTHISKNISISWKWLNAEQLDLWRTFPFDAENSPSLYRRPRWCMISDGNPCRLVDSTTDWPWCTRSQTGWLKFHRNTILHHVCRTQQEVIPCNSRFQRFQPVVNAFKYAFLPRSIPAWNALQ